MASFTVKGLVTNDGIVKMASTVYEAEISLPRLVLKSGYGPDSIKDLADYLKYLDKNDTAYTGLVLRQAASRMLNRQRRTGHPP